VLSPQNVEGPNTSRQRVEVLNIEIAHIDWSHWLAPSMGRILVVMLSIQAILFLSDRFGWSMFNKGHSVFVALAVTAFFSLVFGGCVLISHLTQSRSQYSLSLMLLMIPVMALPCGWLAREMDLANRQRAAVEALRLRKMESLYSTDGRGLIFPGSGDAQVAAWLESKLGREFFSDVTYVDMREATDADLETLSGLNRLELVVLDRSTVTDAGLARLVQHQELRGVSLIDAQVTDAGLEHLQKLPHLKSLFLAGSPVTDQRVKELRSALPECRVVRSRFWKRHW
jgi:hypothetical protein